ncbi:hypothetical protein ACFWMT_01090 [Streptomyces sp. NPDC058368]|uniref:hypothetical protein n=1 Tax=Streptomyces sp. NPDC058368 TaxID=3346461 RepID=UPI00364FD650
MPESLQPCTSGTAITTAAPGWTVTTRSMSSGEVVAAPIAAWILVPCDDGPLGDSGHVHPVFVLDGSTWTTPEYNEVFGYGVEIVPPPATAS